MCTGHCIQVAVGRNGIFIVVPSARDDIVFGVVLQGREIYCDNEVFPWDTKEVGGKTRKNKLRKANSPGITRHFYHFFGHLVGGGDNARTGALTEDITVNHICFRHSATRGRLVLPEVS